MKDYRVIPLRSLKSMPSREWERAELLLTMTALMEAYLDALIARRRCAKPQAFLLTRTQATQEARSRCDSASGPDTRVQRAAEIGAKVTRALDQGRSRAIAAERARSMMLTELVQRAAAADRAAGHGTRGRAGRVRRSLRGVVSVSERHIRNLLARLSRSCPVP